MVGFLSFFCLYRLCFEFIYWISSFYEAQILRLYIQDIIRVYMITSFLLFNPWELLLVSNLMVMSLVHTTSCNANIIHFSFQNRLHFKPWIVFVHVGLKLIVSVHLFVYEFTFNDTDDFQFLFFLIILIIFYSWFMVYFD